MFQNGIRTSFLAAFVLLVGLALAGAGPAKAADSSAIHPACWAQAGLAEDPAAIARTAGRWSCTDDDLSIEAERVLLRFDIGQDQVPPRYFLTRRSALEAVHVLAVDADGAIRTLSTPAGELANAMAGGYLKAPLPQVTRNTTQVIVAIDLPSHRMTLERAVLTPTDVIDGEGDIRFLLVLAGLAGMLVMPLIFNVAFYRVLREPFVLWHSALTLSLLVTILVSSALLVALFDPPGMTLNWITTLVFGFTIASGLMFTHSFIEPGRMHPFLRRILPYCAVFAVSLSVFHAAFPYVARPIQSSVYTAAFAPILIVFVASVVDALRRGSRAARFQAVGYALLIVVGLIRLVTGVVPWLESTDAMLLFYIGCVCEVFFTTLGVADRFVTMKNERDRARTEADLLERLSETDALTGLLNRRAMEGQFTRLRAEGFALLAIIDLDHFKAINDFNGHAVGDAVLKAVANALQANGDVRAYRLGGEEFMLLLRGEGADRHAEHRRQAITAIVANSVPGLDRPVTASMGLTDCLCEEDFVKVYERADRLLYGAKSAGRNRTHSAFHAPALPQAGAA